MAYRCLMSIRFCKRHAWAKFHGVWRSSLENTTYVGTSLGVAFYHTTRSEVVRTPFSRYMGQLQPLVMLVMVSFSYPRLLQSHVLTKRRRSQSRARGRA